MDEWTVVVEREEETTQIYRPPQWFIDEGEKEEEFCEKDVSQCCSTFLPSMMITEIGNFDLLLDDLCNGRKSIAS